MLLILRSDSRSEAGCASSLQTIPAGIPGEPFKSLGFWRLRTHDRTTLIERIAPYMVARLPKAYFIQTVATEYGWPCEILSPGPAQTDNYGIKCWQQVIIEFWESPSKTVEKLLVLAQAWFFTLLRYTYRMRFSARGKRGEIDPIVGDTHSSREAQYAGGLTKRDIYRLIGTPNKYGATFYRSCYADVQRCSEWKRLCDRILWFCKSIQFPTYSDSPEHILKELGGNLPSIILQRRWSHTAIQLAKTSHMAMGTADDMRILGAKVTCEGSCSLKRMKHMEQEIQNLQLHCKTLSLASETMVECKRSIAALTGRIKEDRMDFEETHAFKHAPSSLEAVVACRWLLENLPTTSGKQKGFGIQWRLFWQLQWRLRDEGTKSGKHPLQKLKGDEKYNIIGKNLYGTLSNVLHGYGHLHHVPLHPDVQTMVNIIGPVHYNKDKEINIEAERRRWFTGRSKGTTGDKMLEKLPEGFA